MRLGLAVVVAVVLGAVAGHWLRAAQMQRKGVDGQAAEKQAGAAASAVTRDASDGLKKHGSAKTGRDSSGTGEPLVIPKKAMLRIDLTLMDGVQLNREECRLLGLSDSQIGQLGAVVDGSVKRWRDREAAVARVIPSTGRDQLIYIPSADPAVAEKEWRDMKKQILEIGGADLEPLLDMRLTLGYSPSFESNMGTGMLNIVTGGFGTLERFIRVTPQQSGGWMYDVTDVVPRNIEDPVDEALFRKLAGDRIRIAWHMSLDSRTDADRLAHLPQPK